MSENKGRSPWVWIGCGCGGVILLVAIGLGAAGWFGVRKAQEIQEELTDPDARLSRVLDSLGAEALPEGYYAMMGLRIPFLMEFAMLSDRPADEDGEPQGFGERGFIYFKMITFGKQSQELRDFFEGKTDNADVLRQQNINLRIRERLSSGEVPRDDMQLLWVAHRGSIDAMGSRSDGITSLLLFDCPQDQRMRMGIWFGPEPDRGSTEVVAEAAAEVSGAAVEQSDHDLAGTNADAVEVERFVSGMRPCG